jgi:Mechanosensitive ion channel, conserved TM helix
MNNVWQSGFIEPMVAFLKELGDFLPHLVAMIVVLLLGVLIGWAVKTAVFRVLVTAKFDQYSGRVGLSQALTKGGVRETPAHWVGRIAYWVIVLVFLMLGLEVLNLKPVDQFVAQVFSYLPHMLIAVVILIVGFLLGNFFARATLIAAVNAQIQEARFLARAVRIAIILLAMAMAFEQLGIAKTVIVATFSITLGGVVLALAIAFGLGARDSAKEFIEKRLKKERESKEEDFSHL